MAAFSRKDGLFSALAVATLLIGTATGSAIALFVVSMIMLSLAAVSYRKQLGGVPVLTVAVAAIVAIVIGALIAAG